MQLDGEHVPILGLSQTATIDESVEEGVVASPPPRNQRSLPTRWARVVAPAALLTALAAFSVRWFGNGAWRPNVHVSEGYMSLNERIPGTVANQTEDINAQKMLADAASFWKDANEAQMAADKLLWHAGNLSANASKDKKNAGMTIAAAMKQIQAANATMRDATKTIQQSNLTRKKAQSSWAEANTSKLETNGRLDNLVTIIEDAEANQRKASNEIEAARATEEKAFQQTADARVCFDLPGVRLESSGQPIDLNPIVSLQDVATLQHCPEDSSVDCGKVQCCAKTGMQCYAKDDTWAACMESCTPGFNPTFNDTWTCKELGSRKVDLDAAGCALRCRQHTRCRQSLFSVKTRECLLFANSTSDVNGFYDAWNSSVCDVAEKADQLKAAVEQIYGMKPYIPEITQCAWSGDDCRASKCCADTCHANWNFEKCEWFTCYVKDINFAGCMMGPAPGDWDGTKLGGHAPWKIEPAPEGVLTQGTTLFCFMVVMWNKGPTEGFWDSEAELANNIRKTNRSIVQCDDHDMYEGRDLGGGGDGSIANIDSFIDTWRRVLDVGRWEAYDWTVKVDADCVFIPDRLRWHLKELKTPQGAPAYIRNTFYKFQFLGAIEVFSREAMQLYREKEQECSDRIGHQGGEDYYMLSCMDGIGVGHHDDFKVLNDKYAANENCNDPWVVAFHFYKKVSDWNACWDAAWNAAQWAGDQR